MQLALALDPVSLIVNDSLGEALMLSRQYDDVIAQFRNTLEMDVRFVRSRARFQQLVARMKLPN